jgi:hypothetical protein
MALAALLVLQLVVMPLPPAERAFGTDAHAQALTVSDDAPSPRPWRQAAVGLGLTLLAGSAGLWWLIEKRVFAPLADMTGVVATMAEGHLDQTLDAGAGTELAHLADLINTFSVNQQEGLLFAWNQAGSSLRCLDNLEKHAAKVQQSAAADHPEREMAAMLREVRRTRGHLEGIQALVRTYYLYDVCLDDQKALAAEDAGYASDGCCSADASSP